MTRLQVFVQVEGKRAIRVIELPSNATVEELVRAAQANGMIDASGGNGIRVYAEDGDVPLRPDGTLEASGLGNHSSVHVSHCARVSVTVHYNGQQRTDDFGPGVPMHRVKEWAVGKNGFNLNAVDAAEHVLQLTGTSDRPDEDVHIGSLVGNGCKVEFDLVAKVRVEG